MLTLGELITIVIIGSFGTAVFFLGYGAGLLHGLRKECEDHAESLRETQGK